MADESKWLRVREGTYVSPSKIEQLLKVLSSSKAGQARDSCIKELNEQIKNAEELINGSETFDGRPKLQTLVKEATEQVAKFIQPPPPPPPSRVIKTSVTTVPLDGVKKEANSEHSKGSYVEEVGEQSQADSSSYKTSPPPTKFDAFHEKEVLPILIAYYQALKGSDSAGDTLCIQLLETIHKIEPGFNPEKEPKVSPQPVAKAPAVSGTPGGSGGAPIASTDGVEVETAPMTPQAHLKLLQKLDSQLEVLLGAHKDDMSVGVISGLEAIQVTVKKSIQLVKAEVAKEASQSLRDASKKSDEDDSPNNDEQPQNSP